MLRLDETYKILSVEREENSVETPDCTMKNEDDWFFDKPFYVEVKKIFTKTQTLVLKTFDKVDLRKNFKHVKKGARVKLPDKKMINLVLKHEEKNFGPEHRLRIAKKILLSQRVTLKPRQAFWYNDHFYNLIHNPSRALIYCEIDKLKPFFQLTPNEAQVVQLDFAVARTNSCATCFQYKKTKCTMWDQSNSEIISVNPKTVHDGRYYQTKVCPSPSALPEDYCGVTLKEVLSDNRNLPIDVHLITQFIAIQAFHSLLRLPGVPAEKILIDNHTLVAIPSDAPKTWSFDIFKPLVTAIRNEPRAITLASQQIYHSAKTLVETPKHLKTFSFEVQNMLTRGLFQAGCFERNLRNWVEEN